MNHLQSTFSSALSSLPEQLLWGLSVCFFLGILTLIARNADAQRFRHCTFWFVLALAAAHFFGMVDLIALAETHTRGLFLLAAGYFALGFPWVYLFEWERFLVAEYTRRNEVLAALPPEEAARHAFNEPIRARSHKRKILGWMVWWPMMLLYAVLIRWVLSVSDWIVGTWRRIFEGLIHLFQEKSNRHFAHLMKRPALAAYPGESGEEHEDSPPGTLPREAAPKFRPIAPLTRR